MKIKAAQHSKAFSWQQRFVSLATLLAIVGAPLTGKSLVAHAEDDAGNPAVPPPPAPPPPLPPLPEEEPTAADFPPPPVAEPDSSPAPAPVSAGPSSSASLKAPKNKGTPAVNPQAPGRRVPPGQELVTIDFPEPTEIRDIAKAVSQWTGKIFIIGREVSGKIQLISPQQMTKEEAYQAFLSALNVAGFTTVETGRTVKVVATSKAVSSNIKTFYGASWAPRTDEIITQIVPLKYTDAKSLRTQLSSLMQGTKIAEFSATNSLLITDTGHKVNRLLEIVKLIDVANNQPQVAIIPLKNTDATDISRKITEIFGARGGAASLYLQKTVIDERTNSIILLGPPRGLDDVVRLIKRLDRPIEDLAGQAQVHVRPLDFADAEKLAATLQALASSQGNRGSGGGSGRINATTPRAQGSNGPVSVAELGGVKVTADKSTNALIIQGSKAAFREIDRIIRALDKKKDQVYIEADILDINLKDQFQVGMNLLAGAKVGKNAAPFGFQPGPALPFLANSSSTDPSTLLQAVPQNTFLGFIGVDKFKIGGIEVSPGALIQALKSDGNSNVLQTPSILVADNEEAEFEVTDKEYIKTETQDPTTKLTSQKIEPFEAPLSLKIKPQVSKTDFVNLDITVRADQHRRDATNNVVGTNKRKTTTKLTAQNQQTVVISGLVHDYEDESFNKVPLLGDIPILGWLFRSSNKVKQKANLTVFLTPHVVRNSEDLTKIYMKKLREREEFLRAFYGKDFKEKDAFKRMPGEERGQVPTASAVPAPAVDEVDDNKKPDNTAAPAKGNKGNSNGSDGEILLPSQDPNPIVAPTGAGGGGVSAAPSLPAAPAPMIPEMMDTLPPPAGMPTTAPNDGQ